MKNQTFTYTVHTSPEILKLSNEFMNDTINYLKELKEVEIEIDHDSASRIPLKIKVDKQTFEFTDFDEISTFYYSKSFDQFYQINIINNFQIIMFFVSAYGAHPIILTKK